MTTSLGLLPHTNLCEYLFPLRPDMIVKIVLPLDLTRKEVERLTAFLQTLVVDDQ